MPGNELQKNDLKEHATRGTVSFPIEIYDKTFDSQFTLLAPLHYHSEFELLLATKGQLSVQTETALYQLSEGQGLFINANQLHAIDAQGNGIHGFIAIVFDYRTLCHSGDILFTRYIHPLMNGQLQINHRLPQKICQIICKLNTIYHEENYGFEIEIKQQLLFIFQQLLKEATPTNFPISNSKSTLVKEVLNFIETNYYSPITLQDLSDYVHISREYLCRIFSQVSDVSPITYLNQYRINKSMELLLETDKNITEIAGLCGFNHCSYFNKIFLQYVGCTPGEYRKKL